MAPVGRLSAVVGAAPDGSVRGGGVAFAREAVARVVLVVAFAADRGNVFAIAVAVGGAGASIAADDDAVGFGGG